MTVDWRRTALAVGLTVAHPGLGHLYLREWARSLLWAGGFIVLASAFLPTPPESAGVVEATVTVARQTPPGAAAGLSAVVVGSALDAGLIAARRGKPESQSGSAGGSGDDTVDCPNCGKELDSDLSSCHWCTTRLDGE